MRARSKRRLDAIHSTTVTPSIHVIWMDGAGVVTDEDGQQMTLHDYHEKHAAEDLITFVVKRTPFGKAASLAGV